MTRIGSESTHFIGALNAPSLKVAQRRVKAASLGNSACACLPVDKLSPNDLSLEGAFSGRVELRSMVACAAMPFPGGMLVTSGGPAHRSNQSSGPVKSHGGIKERCCSG